jgi:hypothetical protein
MQKSVDYEAGRAHWDLTAQAKVRLDEPPLIEQIVGFMLGWGSRPHQ